MKDETLLKLSQNFLKNSDSDAVAVSVLDFKNHTFECFEIYNGQKRERDTQIYFDLASLTKPITNSFISISEGKLDENCELLLNHEAGLPSWGLLPRTTWKEQILSYPVKKSPTLYSDFSALRFMLEIEKKTGAKYQDLAFRNLDNKKIKFWRDMDGSEFCVQNGFYNGQENVAKAHDPNAYNLEDFTSHSGLFGTIEGISQALINFDKQKQLLDLMKVSISEAKQRFVRGFDTVSDPEKTLAGRGCSKSTFGHLGFTGTSFWIDPEKNLGQVTLSNAVKKFWFNKKELNILRREIGEYVWKNY